MNPKINNFEYTCCVCFVLHFLSFVDGFGVDLGANLVSKRGAGGQKEVQNEVQVGLGGDSGAKAVSTIITGSVLAPFWRSFWSPKSIIFDIDFVMIFVKCFLLLLEGFGDDFGALLVSKE